MEKPGKRDIDKVPGRYVAEALDRLPPCGPEQKLQQMEIDTGIWGRFRITFKPCKRIARGRWSSSWFWLPDHAERLDVGQ